MHVGIVLLYFYDGRGGAERFGVNLAHELLARGHRVTIFCRKILETTNFLPYFVAPEISVVSLGFDLSECIQATENSASQLAEAQNAIAGTDIDVLAAFASGHQLMLFPALVHGSGIPLLVSEHSAPDIISNERWNPAEHEACMHAADRIHLLLPQHASFYADFLRQRIRTIPNTVDAALLKRSRIRRNLPGKRILGVGRFLERIKQFSLLLKAFALLLPEFPDWRLTLCGDGRDRQWYEKLVHKLGIADKVNMPGVVDAVDAYYLESDIFCMPSRYEGFGLVTIEAQFFGLPVVGFAACSGTNALVTHGKNGLLAKEMTAESLAEQLALLMRDSELRRTMGECARESSSRYDPRTVYDQWEDLLLETAACKGNTQLQRFPAPQTAEAKASCRLHEIISRPTPFARCNEKHSQQLRGEIKKLQTSLHEARENRKKVEDKLSKEQRKTKRMRNSFAWKATAALRFFIDAFKKMAARVRDLRNATP